jgi:hypothetical protein
MPNALVAAAATGLPVASFISTSLMRAARPLPPHKRPVNLTTTLAPWEGPDQFAMTGCGVCMQPEIIDGTPLLFDRTAPVEPGDIVAIWFQPECTPPGEHQILIKRLVRGLPPGMPLPGNRSSAASIRVRMLNPYREWGIPVRRLLGLIRCMGPVPAHVRRIRLSDDEMRRAAAAECLAVA